MRVHILSDLHLEFADFQVPQTDADVIVLAGDIHTGSEGLKWAKERFPATPVVYVLGNHEFYHNALPDLTESLKREAVDSNVHILENSAVEINRFTFLGCTLWTDFEVATDTERAMCIAEQMMNDYRIVHFSPENRDLRATDTIRLHKESVAWLRKSLRLSDPARTVIVTHHAPSLRSEPSFHVNSPLSGAFASNLDELVEISRVPLWIHGHTHYNVDHQIGSTRIVTNQRGYPAERVKGFDPGFIVKLPSEG